MSGSDLGPGMEPLDVVADDGGKDRGRRQLLAFLVPRIVGLIVLVILLVVAARADAHDIYTGVHGKNGQLCCGGDDCARTTYRNEGERYWFRTREGDEVEIPRDRITFLYIPGEDSAEEPEHTAHLCYRAATAADRAGQAAGNVFGDIFLYCAFVPPGGA